MAIQQTLERAIHDVAPQAMIDVRVVNGRLTGTVVASEFEDLTHLDRQRRVWESIRQDLGVDAGQVGMLLLYSPIEADAIEDEED